MSDQREPAFYEIDKLPSFDPIDGVNMSVLAGAQMMANWVRIAPGAEVPAHAHVHEQLGLVLEGEIEMMIDGETRTLGPGTCYCIASDVSHGAVGGPDGALVLDVFSPPREDYLEQAGLR